MASDFEKWVLEETLTAEIAECLIYEAHKKIDQAVMEDDPFLHVYQAFYTLGRLYAILRDRFEEIRQELYKKATWKLLAPNFTEKDFEAAAGRGLILGWRHSLPSKIGKHAVHYGFVAEIVCEELSGRLRYVQGAGWEMLDGTSWERRPKERGIIGLVYDVMRRKINTWRETLSDPMGVGGWLSELEKNINDPDWLSKVEELLLRVDYFGVEIVLAEVDR